MSGSIRFAVLVTMATLFAVRCGGPGQDAVQRDSARDTTTSVDVSALGPQVGELVPDFALKDQSDQVWTRASIMGPRGAMLVFFRSAEWCTYCRTQLVELQSRVEDIRRRGLGLAAISYGPSEAVAAFSEEYGITFPLLSDPGSDTIRRYGLLNTVADAAMDPALGGDLSNDPVLDADFGLLVSVTQPSARFQGIAIPGTLMLDPDGRVVDRFFEDFYRERNTVANIMLRLGEGGEAVRAQHVSTNHLDLTTYASDQEVALGNRFALVFDIEPRADMHVYAPGAVDYRVISVTLDDQPFVVQLPTTYPPAETYYFEPLDEHVPVFQSPFRLVQEIVPEVTPDAQEAFQEQDELTIAGSLEYQACDDRLCYNPVSIPLSWTVALRPFARP